MTEIVFRILFKYTWSYEHFIILIKCHKNQDFTLRLKHFLGILIRRTPWCLNLFLKRYCYLLLVHLSCWNICVIGAGRINENRIWNVWNLRYPVPALTPGQTPLFSHPAIPDALYYEIYCILNLAFYFINYLFHIICSFLLEKG